MQSLQELANPLSQGTIPDLLRPEVFWLPPFISGTGKATDSNSNGTFTASIRNKSLLKFAGKKHGRIQGLSDFGGTPITERVKLYELQILYAHSQDRSEQKLIKNFRKMSRGRSQGLSKISRAPTYMAHRAVIFAIAQLSCYSNCYIRCHKLF